ncbi:MAG: light-harvesting protein [Hyphomonas sp.]|uniref:light-harvesting antenna LH1, alpha subunit n=1 Tax=Hyphomonas sp. TaxID=87 RepID=UPI000D429B59|nr:light-harvesting antenna LH1, alpha subunit [Hyphomonas sp.]MBA4174381.1 light-harvesting protein [Hyphomicrobium sp.]MBA4228993.1 light-harvesting protein [Hyphomonas sp.]PPD30555.1 MAG: light-harvesting protein [Hyphomicrobium sp.]
MYKAWLLVHPVRFLVALYAFLGILAFMIHFILLSTDRYNWLLDSAAPGAKKKAEIHSPMQPVRTMLG